MSAVRVYVDGRPTWRKADDGAVGRMSVAGSIRGSLVVGESERDRILRVTRERLDTMDAAAKAAKSAAQAAYYQRNKQRVLDAQRQRRQAYKRDVA